jgi:uncharacterized membrane protein
MARDMTDVGEQIGNMIGKLARDAAENFSSNGHHSVLGGSNGGGPLKGARGIAAGMALASAPFAGRAVARGVKKLAPTGGDGLEKVKESVSGTVGKGVKEGVGKKIDEAGGAGGVAKKAGKGMLPGLGGGEEGEKGGRKGTPGVGKGRRMPVQQSVDIGVPLSTAYNQWTQFEEWPQFMHRLDQATQEDDCSVSFKTKVWGMSREFEAQIVEQRPDERIQWTVTKGVTHDGVVTFHRLADRLTRVQVSLDVEPGSLLEKAARGMRHVKRAVRADLARFKAFIEMQEVETGAWRGVIHDGELVKQHDRKYDKGRDYADFDDIHDTEHSHSPQKQGGRRSSGKRSSSSGRKRKSSSGPRRRSANRRSSHSRSGSSSRPGSRSSSSSSKSGSNSRSKSGSRGRAKSGSSSGSKRS